MYRSLTRPISSRMPAYLYSHFGCIVIVMGTRFLKLCGGWLALVLVSREKREKSHTYTIVVLIVGIIGYSLH